MAELAKGRMRAKLPLLEQALTGLIRDHHRRMLALQLAHIDFLDEQIDALSAEMMRDLSEREADALPPTPAHLARATGEGGSEASQDAPSAPLSFAQAIAVLDTIPGVDQRSAELLVAEWGTDMRRLGTASRLSAWTGVAPGNDESAGKQRSGKTRRGNRTLRTGLTQMAHVAARTQGTYLSALYQRLAARRGKKRAIMAVAHAIVVSVFHRLARHEPYHELGHNYWDAQRRDHFIGRLMRRIERLGYRVSLDPVPAA
jgi:transposase